MKLSIVIPIYNVEPYIEKCLMSCIQQDIELGVDYEIICVNDGTTDNSAEIVERIAKQYNGIIVIHQKNCGLSVARNNGFAAAQGEYVWFVDSDDWIEDNCLKDLTERLTDNLDILHIKYKYVYEDGTTKPSSQRFLCGIYSGEKVMEIGGIDAPAQFSICRSRFLEDNHLKFYPGIYHEDTEFKPRATYLAKTICFYSKEVYYYLQRESGSITSNYKLKNGLDALTVCNSLYHFSANLSPNHQKYFASKISSVIYTHLFRFRYLSSSDRNKIINCMKQNKQLFTFMIKSKLIKNKIAGILLLINPKLAIDLARFAIRAKN